jgi:hypothetical protein
VLVLRASNAGASAPPATSMSANEHESDHKRKAPRILPEPLGGRELIEGE